MPNISVCIIVKNEEARINRLLDSLLPYPFEIVIIDTGSTDQTVEIAAQYTSSIHHFEWCEDFSAARNFSLSMAQNDWIFVMDSDEWISSIDIEELSYFMKALPSSVGVVNRHNKTGTPDAPEYSTDRTERFFNRSKFHYEGMIHEQLTPNNNSNMDCLLLNTFIEHDGYCMDLKQREVKGKRNLTMLLTQYQKEGPSPYLFYQIGKAYEITHNQIEAMDYYEKALKYDLDYSLAYTQALYIAYLNLLLNLDKTDKAMSVIKQNPVLNDSADYFYSVGKIYLSARQYETAMDCFIKATNFTFANLEGANTYLSYFELSKILLLINEVDSAKSLLQKCGKYAPAIALLQAL